MGASRENADIWWSLFHRYPSGPWRGWRLFHRRFWKNSYLWHDSFGKYWNGLVGCRFRGHGNVQVINDENGMIKKYCFDCQQTMGPNSKISHYHYRMAHP